MYLIPKKIQTKSFSHLIHLVHHHTNYTTESQITCGLMRKVYDCGVILIHLDQKSIKWHFSFSFLFFSYPPSFFASLIQPKNVIY